MFGWLRRLFGPGTVNVNVDVKVSGILKLEGEKGFRLDQGQVIPEVEGTPETGWSDSEVLPSEDMFTKLRKPKVKFGSED